jgi:hypothetical protein
VAGLREEGTESKVKARRVKSSSKEPRRQDPKRGELAMTKLNRLKTSGED